MKEALLSLKKLANDPRSLRVIRYCIVGGLTTFVNFFCFYLLNMVFHAGANAANVVSVIISILFAYVANKIFVFQSKTSGLRPLAREAASFFAGRGLTAALEVGGVYLFHTILRQNALYSKIGVSVVILVLNYLLSRYISFK